MATVQWFLSHSSKWIFVWQIICRIADTKRINHTQKWTLNKEKCRAILFNGPFKLILTHKKPFASIFSSFWLWHCGWLERFMNYYILADSNLHYLLRQTVLRRLFQTPKRDRWNLMRKKFLGAVHVSLDVGREDCRTLGPKNISFSKKKFRSNIWSNFSFESFTEDEAISVQIALKIQSSKKAHILLLISSWLISYLDQIKERLSSLSTNF